MSVSILKMKGVIVRIILFASVLANAEKSSLTPIKLKSDRHLPYPLP
jgi:hypothetical protein